MVHRFGAPACLDHVIVLAAAGAFDAALPLK
jgi:hypothetical protein